MKQLELTAQELIELGFKEVVYPADEMNDEKTAYEIPFINGVFYYNVNNETYRWYHKTVIHPCGSNHVHLSIEKKADLLLVLSCFKVHFNTFTHDTGNKA